MSDKDCVNTIRVLSADMVQKANSGHPGAPIGCAPMAHALFSRTLRFAPKDPSWPARDRFVLSNGHACALLYSLLHLSGYEDVKMDDLKAFRQLGSKTPGHPEAGVTGGVEVSTGPLGQGLSNAVGIAIAAERAASEFNVAGTEFASLFASRTYVICGDGCLMEGITAEAASLAGHLGLGSLTVLYDDNAISIDGGTDLAFSEDVLARFAAYGWHTERVADGDDPDAAAKSISEALDAARAETGRPSIIAVKTTIGLGSSKEGTQKVHGSPLGAEDLAAFKTKYGFDPEASFVVPDAVAAKYAEIAAKGNAERDAWEALVAKYAAAHPEKAAELERRRRGDLPADFDAFAESLVAAAGGDDAGNKDATRKSGGKVLNALADKLPEVIGGSADLNPSTLTYINSSGDFSSQDRSGRNIRFGVREHAMAAVCNGIAAHGMYLPYCSTFLVFVGYAYGSVRLSSLSHAQVLYVMTHDSIGVGEDGPTHQPIEVLGLLRSTPNMVVARPADAREVAGVYAAAIRNKKGPTTLSLSRQSAPVLEGSSAEGAQRGAYVLRSGGDSPKLVIAGSGTEVGLCAAAAAKIGGDVRVVSVPSMELFENQDAEYRKSVFPAGVPVLAVEAAEMSHWRKYAHATHGMTTFGTSAPGSAALSHFGFTADNVEAKAKALLAHFDGKPAPATYIEL